MGKKDLAALDEAREMLAGEWSSRNDAHIPEVGAKAAAIVSRYLKKKPDDPEALLLLARAFRTDVNKAKLCEDTLDKLHKLLDGGQVTGKRLATMTLEVTFESAHLYLEADMFSHAVPMYQRAHDMAPRGSVEKSLGKQGGAITMAKHVRSTPPAPPAVHEAPGCAPACRAL